MWVQILMRCADAQSPLAFELKLMEFQGNKGSPSNKFRNYSSGKTKPSLATLKQCDQFIEGSAQWYLADLWEVLQSRPEQPPTGLSSGTAGNLEATAEGLVAKWKAAEFGQIDFIYVLGELLAAAKYYRVYNQLENWTVCLESVASRKSKISAKDPVERLLRELLDQVAVWRIHYEWGWIEPYRPTWADRHRRWFLVTGTALMAISFAANDVAMFGWTMFAALINLACGMWPRVRNFKAS